MVHTWYSSLAHLRQRLCRQGRITTGFVNTSRQMGQMSCFSSVPIEDSLWSERISSGRDIAVCPCWPHTHWKLRRAKPQLRRWDATVSMSLCCSYEDFQSLEAAGSRSAPVLEQDDGASVGLQLKMYACTRGGRCPVSCWLTVTPLPLISCAHIRQPVECWETEMKPCLLLLQSFMSTVLKTANKVNNTRIAIALEERMFIKRTQKQPCVYGCI